MAGTQVKQVNKLVRKQMGERGIKRESDVEELYLADSGITEINSLSNFRNLRYLWLSGNKLRRISCLHENFRLSELYLQNNQLVEVTGALMHLTSLQVLMLQNNQLTNLQTVMRELSEMTNLKTLNLFENPVSQEPGYRLYVLKMVPSIELLDRQEVTYAERKKAEAIYNEETEIIKRRIAFGRRAPGSSWKNDHAKIKLITMDATFLGNSYMRDNPLCDSIEKAAQERRSRNMVSLFTHFDWSKVPRIQERRMAEKPFDSPELLTHVYR